MALVKLFGNLRKYVDEHRVDVPGDSVMLILEGLFAGNVGLKTAVSHKNTLRPFIRITVNGHDIELLDGLETAVTASDQIAIFPPIAGG